MYCDALLPYPYPPSVTSEADEDNTTKQLRKQTHSSTVQKRENGTKRVSKMRQNASKLGFLSSLIVIGQHMCHFV